MRKIFLLPFLLAIISVFGQASAEEFEVLLGQKIAYNDLEIYFYDIEDSRCPSDVTCVWEGNVLAMIRISNSTQDIGGPQEIGFVQKSFPHYLIELRNVLPHPVSTEKPEYIAVLDITKTSAAEEKTCEDGLIPEDGICISESDGVDSDLSGLYVGKIMWYEENFHNLADSFAKKIQVTDPDMNKDDAKIETVPVRIWSDSDSKGITVSAQETGKNTGIFEIVIYFAERNSAGQRISVQIGDTVTAQYTDEKTPDGERMQVSDILTVKGFSHENDSNFRAEDPDFVRQVFQTTGIFPYFFVVQIFEGLGAGLIVLFIVIFAIKKRRQK